MATVRSAQLLLENVTQCENVHTAEGYDDSRDSLLLLLLLQGHCSSVSTVTALLTERPRYQMQTECRAATMEVLTAVQVFWMWQRRWEIGSRRFEES